MEQQMFVLLNHLEKHGRAVYSALRLQALFILPEYPVYQ